MTKNKVFRIELKGPHPFSPNYNFVISYDDEKILEHYINGGYEKIYGTPEFMSDNIMFFIHCLRAHPEAKLPEDLKLLLVGYMI